MHLDQPVECPVSRVAATLLALDTGHSTGYACHQNNQEVIMLPLPLPRP